MLLLGEGELLGRGVDPGAELQAVITCMFSLLVDARTWPQSPRLYLDECIDAPRISYVQQFLASRVHVPGFQPTSTIPHVPSIPTRYSKLHDSS